MTSPRRSAFDITHTWFVGGALLIVPLVLSYGLETPGIMNVGALGPILFAAALLVFAIGIRGTESVTARRPLGTTALVLLAVWVLGQSVVSDVLSTSISLEALTAIASIDPFIRFALSLIAVVQIGRTATVPSPWNWAPALGLAAVTVPWLLGVVFAAIPAQTDMTTLLTLTAVDGVLRSTSAVFLGVLAILLADRSRRHQTVAAPAPTSSGGD